MKFVREKKAEKRAFFQFYFDDFFDEQISFLTAESMTKYFFWQTIIKNVFRNIYLPLEYIIITLGHV